MKEIHIAYAGSPFITPWMVSFVEIIQKITAQGIHFHTYDKCSTESENKLFLKEEKNNPYFHYHDKTNPKKLNEEISNYHYGIIPQFFYPSLIDSRWIKTTMSNKMFNYLEAGLPVIIGKQGKVMVDVTNEHDLGICIDYEDISNLKKILNRLNYEKLQKNVKIAQKN